jgi:hypothetical protein
MTPEARFPTGDIRFYISNCSVWSACVRYAESVFSAHPPARLPGFSQSRSLIGEQRTHYYQPTHKIDLGRLRFHAMLNERVARTTMANLAERVKDMVPKLERGKNCARRAAVLAYAMVLLFVTVQQSAAILNINRSAAGCDSKGELKEPNHDENSIEYTGYIPASSEDFVFQNAAALGYNTTGRQTSAGCPIWKYPNATNPSVHANLMQYKSEMLEYNRVVREFTSDVVDLRLHLGADPSTYDICKTVDLHPDGLKGIFNSSGQLSYTPSGFVEPLLPPMRSPDYCDIGYPKLFDLTYLVHDFGAMCRKLKPTSRIVLFDLGASLQFAGTVSPAIYLTELYHKFGFPFDHIYAYEVNPTDPKKVFDSVPRLMLPAYHWINVGVSSTPDSHLNPLTTLLDKYNEDDLVIVKLDIDTPSLELPLALQILEDERIGKLVDQFYFEHHVHLSELASSWGRSMTGSVKESLDLFHGLREKGVPAHFWV